MNSARSSYEQISISDYAENAELRKLDERLVKLLMEDQCIEDSDFDMTHRVIHCGL